MDKTEIRDIIVSWLAVSIAFGWAMRNSFASEITTGLAGTIGFSIIVAMIAVGSGFVLHELAHRAIAIRFGAHARYVVWPQGLVLALLLAFFTGFVFAAPGAVYIFSAQIDKKKNAIISLAGPLTNFSLGIVFLAVFFLLGNSLLGTIAAVAASINAWLAVFNMFPFAPLDGSKIFSWNKAAWLAALLPMLALMLLI